MSNTRKLSSREIQKVLDLLIGETEPVADSAIDARIEENLMVLIDIINWSLDGIYMAARHRKSPYRSEQVIGERAYSSILEWKEWADGVEEELA